LRKRNFELNSVMESGWASRLEQWLQARFSELGRTAGSFPPAPGLRINPPLAEEEANYFLLGLEEGLFRLNEKGAIESELLRVPGESLPPMEYRIFGQEASPSRLLREAICQLATAARLIFQRGWLKSHVTLEPGKDAHRATGAGFDLFVRSPAGRILVWVEVKRSAVELNKLIVDLRACSRRGPHGREDCGFPQNHPRYEFGLCHTPDYLWAVAPDGSRCFRMTCENGAMELEELPSLPPRSLLE
jgi:hypothetical protein